MDPISSALIAKALDGLSMRYQATAENIANANSRGYQPVRVTFEGALREAAGQGAAAIRGVRPEIVHAASVGAGAEVRLDLELASAAETANRYAALIDLLGRQAQIARTVVSGGQ